MNTKEYFKQLSIVILGILVAFWINNIGMRHKENTTQKQVLSAILTELQDNQSEVDSAHINMNALIESLKELKQATLTADTKDTTNITINYISSDFKDIGYEIAKQTGILKDIDHQLVSQIVECYEIQKSLKEMERIIRDELFSVFKKVDEYENTDYLIMQLSNLINNLDNYKDMQKKLIDKLTNYLN